MSEIFSDLAASNINLRTRNKDSILRIGHHDLLIWDEDTNAWQINPAFLLHAANQITWSDNDNNTNVDVGELSFGNNTTSNKKQTITEDFVSSNENSNGVITSIIIDPTKGMTGLHGHIYFLSDTLIDNCKGYIMINDIKYCVLGTSLSNNTYIDLFGDVENTNYGFYFNTIVNLENTQSIDKILFEPINDLGNYYNIDMDDFDFPELQNSQDSALIRIPNSDINLRNLDDSWIILNFDYTKKVDIYQCLNDCYNPVSYSIPQSFINFESGIDVHSYSVSADIWIEVSVANVNTDFIFIEETATGTLVGESHTGTDASGSNLFYIKVYGSNANINYTLYYYNYANHKIYLFQSFTLNIHVIHEYGYFSSSSSPLNLNDYESINKVVYSKYDWVSINVKPRGSKQYHTIPDVFTSLLSPTKVLDGIKTHNYIWIISNTGIVGSYYNGYSWVSTDTVNLSQHGLFILQLNTSSVSYNWTYDGTPYINGESISIELQTGINWVGYPLRLTSNISNYTDLYNNYIKINSQSSSLSYNGGLHIGALSTFSPNEGYIIEMSGPATLTFTNTINFMIEQGTENINYFEPNTWILNVESIGLVTLETRSTNDIILNYRGISKTLSLTSGSILTFDKSIYNYTADFTLFTFGDITNVSSIEVETEIGFKRNEFNNYINNITGKLKITTKLNPFTSDSTLTEYLYDGFISGTETPLPTSTPTPTPTIPSIINGINILQSYNVGKTSLTFTIFGSNVDRWSLKITQGVTTLLNTYVSTSSELLDVTSSGDFNIEAYVVDSNNNIISSLYTSSFNVPLQITDLIISQPSDSFDVTIQALNNVSSDVQLWSIETLDGFVSTTDVTGTNITITFSSSGSTTFKAIAKLDASTSSGDYYQESFIVSQPPSLQSNEGNVDLGSGFSIETNDSDYSSLLSSSVIPTLDFLYDLNGSKTSIMTIEAQDGTPIVPDDSQGSTQISNNWIFYWPLSDVSSDKQLYITYKNIPQTLIIPDTNPLQLEPKSFVFSSLNIGPLWAIDTTRSLIDIYFRESQQSNYFPQLIIGNSLYSEASYSYFSDYTTDDDVDSRNMDDVDF